MYEQRILVESLVLKLKGPGTACHLARLLCAFFLNFFDTALGPIVDLLVGGRVGCSWSPTTVGRADAAE
jgi:hypothetical protein